MNNNLNTEPIRNYKLFKYLSKLNPTQLKIFYGAFVHYWVNHRFFISKQNFFNLWCELNFFCHELDESFPDQYDNHEEIKSFWHKYPYCFTDILPTDLIAKLFAEHVDDHVDILKKIVKKIYNTDIYSAYTYANHALKRMPLLYYIPDCLLYNILKWT